MNVADDKNTPNDDSSDAIDEDSDVVKDRYQLYTDYNKILRSWLVAYGIGGPILFATNEHLNSVLKCSEYSKLIVSFFLVGVGLQVLNAFINKWCAWHVYYGEADPAWQVRKDYKFFFMVNEWHWLDILFDISAIAMFGIATVWVVTLF
jgi:hypothetical protein